MRVISFSSDKEMFNEDSDSFKRMSAYAKLVDELHIINFCIFKEKKAVANLIIHPTGSRTKLVNFFRAVKIGLAVNNEKNIDLVISQDPKFTGLAALIVSKMAKSKLMVSVYGSNIFNPFWIKESFINRFFNLFGRLILAQADAIQTDGFETVEDLKKRYGDKVFWKPLVPQNIMNYKAVEKSFSEAEFKAVFIGRLVEQKNIPLLLEVIDKILKLNLNKKITFTLVGDGPLWDYLNDEVGKRGLNDLVKLQRGCTRHELIDFYSSNDILIMTSYYEGFPRVFMEAAASGLPIVSTRVSGTANVIKNGESGYIINQGDADDFVAKLKTLIEQPDIIRQFSKKIREDFWKNYDFQVTLDIQKKIFDYFKHGQPK